MFHNNENSGGANPPHAMEYFMIINPLEEITADISPIEFEQLCLNLLAETKNFNKIEDVKVEHNKIIEVNDGTYQLDGYIEYEFCGSIQKIIVECKKHKNSIKRDDVVILKEKLHSIGANKGILISTSGFQEGALKYAKKHGIALMQVINSSLRTMQNSITVNKNLIQKYMSLPKYSLMMFSNKYFGVFFAIDDNPTELKDFFVN